MLSRHGRADREPAPGIDGADIENEKRVYVPNEYRNISREAKHQLDLLKYHNHLGALAGQEDRI